MCVIVIYFTVRHLLDFFVNFYVLEALQPLVHSKSSLSKLLFCTTWLFPLVYASRGIAECFFIEFRPDLKDL